MTTLLIRMTRNIIWWKTAILLCGKKISLSRIKNILLCLSGEDYFCQGVDVAGPVYGYDKLKKVVFENPRNMIDARYNKCPKLKRLYLPDRISPSYVDIKNCPSLQVTIDKKNKKMKVIGKDVYSKNGMLLYNVVNGKKYIG